MYTIRKAEASEAQAILDLLYPAYFNETVFRHLTFNPENAMLMIGSWLAEKHVLLANGDEKLIGIAVIQAGRTYYEEIEADIEFFFVDQEHRGTTLGRDLAQMAIGTAQEVYSASVLYSTCASGIDEKNDSLWVNLWKKLGFKKLGTIMIGGI